MKRGTIIATLVLGALFAGVTPQAAWAQARGGASHPTASAPGQQTTAPSRPIRPLFQQHFKPIVPVPPPFPDIATLSGPLPGTFNPPLRNDQFRVRGPFRTPPSLYPGYVYGPYEQPAAESAMEQPPAQLATGLLRLDMTPGSAQVFVDGYYVGTADDIENRRGVMLPEGPHRLEFRRQGYDPEAADVRIMPNDVVTYRGELDVHRPPPPAVSRQAATMYIVPGCYMGNVPPRQDRVASDCDVKKVRVVPPPGSPDSAATPRGRH